MPLVNMNGLDTVSAAPEQVWAEVDTALLAARDTHRAALERAQADVAAAQQRLDEHQAQMPDNPADIPAWARRKVELAAELEAYHGVVTRATERLQQVQQAVDDAYRDAWFVLHRAALEGFDAEEQVVQARIEEAKRHVEVVEEQGRQALITAANRVTALRHCMPRGVELHQVAHVRELVNGRMF